MPKAYTITADPDDAGQRLDKFLATRLPDFSRARLQALVADGAVRRDGLQIADGSARVKPGQHFSVDVPDARPATPSPEAIPLDVLFEDEHLLVLEKPTGMVVHPAPGHSEGTLVHALLHHCQGSLSGIGGVQRPGIVHRLDKDVSGLMVVAKHDKAHIGLSAQFTVHRIDRAYEAIVWGVPECGRGYGRQGDRETSEGPKAHGRGRRRQTRGHPLSVAGGGRQGGVAPRSHARDRAHPPDPRASRHASVSASSVIQSTGRDVRLTVDPSLRCGNFRSRAYSAACAASWLRTPGFRQETVFRSRPAFSFRQNFRTIPTGILVVHLLLMI